MTNSEYLINRKDEILKEDILSEEIFELYQTLYLFQENFIKIFNESNEETLDINIQDLPIIKAENFTIPENKKLIFNNSLEELIKILEKNQAGIKIQNLLTTYSDNLEILINSVKLIMSHNLDQLKFIADELKIGTDEYIFILVNWIKPYFISLKDTYKDQLNNIDYSDWHEQTCPFCGYYPDISKIVESNDNQRILHCGLCENQWQYKRLSCTICDNEEHGTLGYYQYQDNEIYRIDYCKECSGYIKTIMIPKQFSDERFNLTVENIISNFLDATAIEMGYNRP